MTAQVDATNQHCEVSEWKAYEPTRLAALKGSGLMDTPADAEFDRFTRLASHLVSAPVSMISLVDAERQFFKSVTGLPEELCGVRETPRSHSFCRHVVESRDALVVQDARTHSLVRDSPLIVQFGTVAYLGVPIIVEGGAAIGALCVTDPKPREWTDEDAAGLRDVAALVSSEITLRARKREQEIAMLSLGESEARFRQLTESIREVFWIFAPDGSEILYLSPAFDEIWGRSRAELYRDHSSWQDSVANESIPVFRAFLDTLGHGNRAEVEFEIVRPDTSRRWIRNRGFPVLDDDGNVVRLSGVAEDVTQKKVTEAALAQESENRRLAEKKLLRAQRLESIGTLASGLAHDLNNLLSPILMSAPLLRDEQPESLRAELVSTVERCAERAAGIVKQVLTFARGMDGERQPLRPKDLVKEIGRMITETFPKSITIQCVPQPDMKLIAGDATQLHQVLMNLCVNARDAMPQGGTLTVAAENFYIDDSYAGMILGARPGAYVRITVEDTGIGISREHMEKIFDPFFTTKPLGKGTGLGLSSVMGIVKSHQGFLDVRSTPGRGTQFSVFLPALDDGVAEPALVATERADDGKGEVVLLVDDEAEVLKSTAISLSEHGYKVITASDGVEALSAFAENAERIQVVLTDVMMPVVDGVALTRSLRVMAPEIPILALTGWGDERRLQELSSLNVSCVLQKPFTSELLLQAMRKALGARR